MKAIFKTGGKQYKVQKDAVLAVEKLAGKAGDKVSLKEVIMVGDKVDIEMTPYDLTKGRITFRHKD